MKVRTDSLPNLRFEISEAAQILRLSRAAFYQRVRRGEIALSKDGRRSYVAASELERYVATKTHSDVR
jgi:excisionase family DNA binding protein